MQFHEIKSLPDLHRWIAANAEGKPVYDSFVALSKPVLDALNAQPDDEKPNFTFAEGETTNSRDGKNYHTYLFYFEFSDGDRAGWAFFKKLDGPDIFSVVPITKDDVLTDIQKH